MKLMLIAGFGFRASADIHSLANAFEKTATGGLVDGFSAPADKIDHPALTALARRYEIPVYAVETETIKATDTLTQSATVRKWRQTGSVAEAAALAPFTSLPDWYVQGKSQMTGGLFVPWLKENAYDGAFYWGRAGRS